MHLSTADHQITRKSRNSGETNFFRSVGRYPDLERIFSEDLLDARARPFKICVAGCSTGKDVYSYALLCDYHSFKHYSVHGYDVYEGRLKKARERRYFMSWESSVALLRDPRTEGRH